MISVVLSAQQRATARRARRRLLKFNELGRRIGETHHKAVLTDHEVDLLLELRAEIGESGRPKYSYGWLAEKFEVSKMTVRSICRGRTRGGAVHRTVLEVVDA